MREKVELIQRSSVCDTISNVAEPRGNGQKDILSGSRRAECTDLTDRIVTTTNAIEQPITNKASEKIPRCGRGSPETPGGLSRSELGQTFAGEVIEQPQTCDLSLGS